MDLTGHETGVVVSYAHGHGLRDENAENAEDVLPFCLQQSADRAEQGSKQGSDLT